MDSAIEPLVLTIGEAAELLRISRAKAYRLAAAGELPTVKIGATLRVPLEGLRAYIRRRAAAGTGGVVPDSLRLAIPHRRAEDEAATGGDAGPAAGWRAVTPSPAPADPGADAADPVTPDTPASVSYRGRGRRGKTGAREQ